MRYTRPPPYDADASWSGAHGYTRSNGNSYFFWWSPIGAVQIVINEPRSVFIQIPRVLGSVQVVAGKEVIRARIRVPRVLGAVRARVGRSNGARIKLPRVLGAIRLQIASQDNPWVRYGLPAPLQDSYSYQPSERLVRTQMLSGYTRQRRMWRDGYRKASVTLELTRTQLVSLEEFLDEIGGDWFKMPLLTGDNPTRVATDHRVRVMGDHSVSDVDWQMVRVVLPLEVKLFRSLLVTTTLYPLESIETSGVEAGVAFTGVLAVGALRDAERTSVTAPAPFTGTLEQTVWRRRIDDLESTSVTAPAPFTGTLEQTVWHRRIDDLESTSVTAPAPFTGTLEQTVWHLRIDDAESTSVTAPAPFTGTLQ